MFKRNYLFVFLNFLLPPKGTVFFNPKIFYFHVKLIKKLSFLCIWFTKYLYVFVTEVHELDIPKFSQDIADQEPCSMYVKMYKLNQFAIRCE